MRVTKCVHHLFPFRASTPSRRTFTIAVNPLSGVEGTATPTLVVANFIDQGGVNPANPNPAGDYTATIDTSEGAIQLSLDTANSLKVANNFVFLAQHKFYNGLRFVRVAKDFVIQAGSPKNTTTGGPGYSDVGSLPTTPADQPAYPVGTVAMANAPKEPAGTFGSQFFIVTGSSSSDLLPDYAIVGRVTGGLDVAQKIGLLYPKSGDGKPTKTVTIRKVTINSQPAARSSTTATTVPATTAAP